MNEIIDNLSQLDMQGILLLASMSDYALIAVFVSVFFLGEVAIFVSLVLAQQGVFSLEFVFVSSLLATISADTSWFLISRFFPQRLIPRAFRQVTPPPTITPYLHIIRDKAFLSILFLKFFIGTRLAIIVYLAQQSISFFRFFIYNFIGAFIYVLVITSIAVLFSEFISKAFATYRLVTSLILGFVLVYLLSLMAKRLYAKFVSKGSDGTSLS
ncbi:MAG: hypothetical protein R3B53_03360 [Candidatus Paceibacterota bacterium]